MSNYNYRLYNCVTWMSMAGAKVCVTLAAMEKSPVVTILCTMSLEFTIATSFTGNPICFTMNPAETQTDRQDRGTKHFHEPFIKREASLFISVMIILEKSDTFAAKRINDFIKLCRSKFKIQGYKVNVIKGYYI